MAEKLKLRFLALLPNSKQILVFIYSPFQSIHHDRNNILFGLEGTFQSTFYPRQNVLYLTFAGYHIILVSNGVVVYFQSYKN